MRRPVSLLLAAMAVQLAGQAQAPPPGKLTVRTVEAGTNSPLPGVWVSGVCFGAFGEYWQYQETTDNNGEMSVAVRPGECVMGQRSERPSGRRIRLWKSSLTTPLTRAWNIAIVAM